MIVVGRGGEPRRIEAGAKSWPLAGTRYTSDLGISIPRTVEMSGGSTVPFERLYRSQPMLWACVNKLARLSAMLPIDAYRPLDGGEGREAVRSGGLPELIETPWPRATRFDLIESIVRSLGIHGHSLTVKWRPSPGAPPEELWPIPWQHVSPIEGKDRPIEGYRYDGPGGERIFLPEDVIHLTLAGGVSPMEPLRETLASEDANRRYERGNFEGGARPTGALVTSARLKQDQKDKLRSEIQSNYVGADARFRVLLLDGGLEWQQMSYSAQEAEALGFRALNAEEVARAYDVPQPAIGILTHATYSNVTELHRMLYQDTLGPWLKSLELGLVAQLVRPEPAWADLFVEFNLSGVLRGNPKERTEAYQREFMSALVTPNELRRRENLPPIDDPLADCVAWPVNTVPIGPGAEAFAERTGGTPPPASGDGPEPPASSDLEDRVAALEEQLRSGN